MTGWTANCYLDHRLTALARNGKINPQLREPGLTFFINIQYRKLIMPDSIKPHPASFRDPAGFVFEYNSEIYRALAQPSKEDYDLFMACGLYGELTSQSLLVRHQITQLEPPDGCFLVIKPQRADCITYPYEWSFSQLKEAALLTLKIQQISLKYGMSLKDASAFNVAWRDGRFIFIDTLSFTAAIPDSPWHAYAQFCSHFLAPLLLMSVRDIRLQKLLQSNLGGIPLDLASALLPCGTWLRLGSLLHIHLHARAQKRHAGTRKKLRPPRLNRKALDNLIEDLSIMVEGLRLPSISTEWGEYYSDTNYTQEQLGRKAGIISGWLEKIKPKVVCDLGANDGRFSRLASETASLVVAADIDPIAVETNYLRCKKENSRVILPLLQDLTQPSPALGWQLQERAPLKERISPDLGMALALLHHLVIGNNVPFSRFVSFRAECAPQWIVEFPDKDDSQVQRLIMNRPDIFSDYGVPGFERALGLNFTINDKQAIEGTRRTLYLIERKNRL